MKRRAVRVFRYIEALDAFLPTDEYLRIANELGLSEWTPVVWIGRLFMLDNDYGEHWFDNWHEREQRRTQAEAMGIEPTGLLIIDPDCLQNGYDGPCHAPEQRARFWRDVLRSMTLSDETLFAEARSANEAALASERRHNEAMARLDRLDNQSPHFALADLEERIARVQAWLGDTLGDAEVDEADSN